MSASESFGTVVSKLLITVFLVLAAVAAAWTGIKTYDLVTVRKAVEEDEKRLKEIEKIAPVVQELAEQGYDADRLREERRTGNWTTFFASTAQAAGLARNQYKLPARKTARGKGFLEHSFEIRINPKTGVTRQTVARFLWSVESRRTYLKTRAVELTRVGDGDDWGGTVTITYREKP